MALISLLNGIKKNHANEIKIKNSQTKNSQTKKQTHTMALISLRKNTLRGMDRIDIKPFLTGQGSGRYKLKFYKNDRGERDTHFTIDRFEVYFPYKFT